MRIVLYVVGALIVIGIFKGMTDIQLEDNKNAVIEIVSSVLGGVRDMTIYLIPTIVGWGQSLVDQLPNANA